jgi:hypothetical protein
VGESSIAAEGVNVTFIHDGGSRAITLTNGGNQLPAVPEGSVTAEGIQRAARRVAEEVDGRKRAIAEVTLARTAPRY